MTIKSTNIHDTKSNRKYHLQTKCKNSANESWQRFKYKKLYISGATIPGLLPLMTSVKAALGA